MTEPILDRRWHTQIEDRPCESCSRPAPCFVFEDLLNEHADEYRIDAALCWSCLYRAMVELERAVETEPGAGTERKRGAPMMSTEMIHAIRELAKVQFLLGGGRVQ